MYINILVLMILLKNMINTVSDSQVAAVLLNNVHQNEENAEKT